MARRPRGFSDTHERCARVIQEIYDGILTEIGRLDLPSSHRARLINLVKPAERYLLAAGIMQDSNGPLLG